VTYARKHAGFPAILGAVWLLVVAWQVIEHRRLRATQRLALLNRAQDIATSLEVVIRSQSHLQAIARARLQAALEALARTRDLRAVAVVNPGGEVIASAGPQLPAEAPLLQPGRTVWTHDTLTVVQLVQFGDRPSMEAAQDGGLLLVEPEDAAPPEAGPTDGPPRPEPSPAPPPPPRERADGHGPHRGGRAMGPHGQQRGRRVMDPDVRDRLQEWFREYAERGERPAFPPWLTEREFRERFETHGLRKFVLVLSTTEMMSHLNRDLWQRAVLAAVALCACAALAVSWRSLQRATRLEVRLVRSQELNEHLRDMNAAAAGLAHETRNPLNVVRGLAQLIVEEADDPDATRHRADRTIEEVDRINSRLNEFIDYSRPREPQLEPVRLDTLVADVARTLDPDREEKDIELSLAVLARPVEADPALLRQVIFNLLLNAYQALPGQGRVIVRAVEDDEGIQLSVSDNGTGIAPEHRESVFRAYFTLNESGSGLGLAVVRQIVLQHHWDIECGDAAEGGAEFRITGIRPARDGHVAVAGQTTT
jgi:signal transduction histidine kinase